MPLRSVHQMTPDSVDYFMDVSEFQKNVGGIRWLALMSLLPFCATLVILCVVYIIVFY